MHNAFQLLQKDVQALATERFGKLTDIQQAVIPEILAGNSLLVIAETGSGKTEACMLPLFSRLAEHEHRPISLLYITPLRSLNRDLMKRLVWWSEKLDISISVRHGDTTQYERSMQAANPAEIMILTPETLQAILVGKRMREHLKNVMYVVVDEIHELVDSKRGSQLAVGLERLRRLIGEGRNDSMKTDGEEDGEMIPENKKDAKNGRELKKKNIDGIEVSPENGEKKFQIIGLSATVGNPEDIREFLHANSVINTLKAKSMELIVENPRNIGEGIKYIADAMDKSRGMLIFSNTRETAEALSSRLKNEGLPVETHHSSLSKDVRVKAEEDFKSGKTKAIVCTSSLELGIDIGSVDTVIQYGSPRQVSKLLQRVGRSGHTLGRTSRGLILAADADDAMEAVVIARHAMQGLVEKATIYEKPLDVLAHQLVGICLDKYDVTLAEAFNLIKNAYPFRNLEFKELEEISVSMERLGFIWIRPPEDGNMELATLRRRSEAFAYYNENLSTIPARRTYAMIDVTGRKHVATLDSDFVSLNLYPSAAFISKGQGWRVVSIDEGKVFAEPLEDTEAAIPAWQGEMIPVPKEVANEVGEAREKLRKILDEGKDRTKAIGYLEKTYPVTRKTAEIITDYIEKQPPEALPSDKRAVIEHGTIDRELFMVIHSCNGSRANETLGRAMASIALGKISSIGLETDPYRIIFKIKKPSDRLHLLDILEGMSGRVILQAVQLGLADSEMLAWHFSQVARRFGIISKDADYGKLYLKKALRAYLRHPAYREAMNEIIQEKLDVQSAEQFTDALRSGRLGIWKHEGLTPIGLAGIAKRYEILASAVPTEEIMRIFKERIHKSMLALVCCSCGTIAVIGTVEELVKRKLDCGRCGSKMLGVSNVARSSSMKAVIEKNLRNGTLSKEEQRDMERLTDSAALVVASGHEALKVLAARGIGTRTAARILARRNTGDSLYEDMLRAERQYVRTRGFWRD